MQRHDAPQPAFQFAQKVQVASGEQGRICGYVYYSDAQQWHYALSFDPQQMIPAEVWYTESELMLR
ncbi:MAG: hypothetical protein WBA10_17705 [Elainellaceae cyanobacterium]